MTAFAFYRLPCKQTCTFIMQNDGTPEEIYSVEELNGKSGFVFAPFMPSTQSPILLIKPEVIKKFTIEEEHYQLPGDISECVQKEEITQAESNEKSAYTKDFKCFHEQLQCGIFKKIVLARCSHLKSEKDTMPKAEDLFMKACRMYPRLFIALVSTPQSGIWLMATPEILLCGDGCEFTTMALAGTLSVPPSANTSKKTKVEAKWTQKEIEEQRYVSKYIEKVISSFCSHYSSNGPYTTMAAQLYHLETDFDFRLKDTNSLGDILNSLFPTPAVCGMPKNETRRFIIANESIDRKYYSGFVGPLVPTGKTELYVSLRCMNILPGGKFDLYAGGGLLKESNMESEWNETEAKMQTMRKVIEDV